MFAEVLAEAGASVVGIAPEYHCLTLQDFIEYSHEHFDVAVCSDVLEHVTNPQDFAALCCQLVKPGGCIVFSTIIRTIFSLLWNMILFEDVLGICARWLHRLYLCVKPEEVRQVTDRLNFRTVKTVGLVWQPLDFNFLNNAGKFNWIETWFTGCAYAILCKHQT
ncbi:hypothetical protein RvY_10941 [Ramazzottius varieornatus]|uniref:Methyltransferase type 11 domain-containing protein n=1 Tax=Ramazzottius varieornatus TaxID=947166 RepID=A0A1D1VEF6_RAMVA|nr:hypothetical protein RvY_10941 [Ramazzottius varieornatus]